MPKQLALTLPLTGKQDKFALLVAAGMDQTGAYEQAYETTTGNRETVVSAASELAAKPHVAARIRQLRDEAKERVLHSQINLKDFVLSGLIDLAKNAKSESVRRQSLETLGKTNVVGLFEKEQTPDDLTKLSNEQLATTIRDKLMKALKDYDKSSLGDGARVINGRISEATKRGRPGR